MLRFASQLYYHVHLGGTQKEINQSLQYFDKAKVNSDSGLRPRERKEKIACVITHKSSVMGNCTTEDIKGTKTTNIMLLLFLHHSQGYILSLSLSLCLPTLLNFLKAISTQCSVASVLVLMTDQKSSIIFSHSSRVEQLTRLHTNYTLAYVSLSMSLLIDQHDFV